MAQCENTWSYDHTNEKNNRGFTTRKAQKERQALKKATRKFSRACQQVLIREGLADKDAMEQTTPNDLLQLAKETRWGIDDILAMFDAHEQLPESVIFESQRLYEDYMVGVDY